MSKFAPDDKIARLQRADLVQQTAQRLGQWRGKAVTIDDADPGLMAVFTEADCLDERTLCLLLCIGKVAHEKVMEIGLPLTVEKPLYELSRSTDTMAVSEFSGHFIEGDPICNTFRLGQLAKALRGDAVASETFDAATYFHIMLAYAVVTKLVRECRTGAAVHSMQRLLAEETRAFIGRVQASPVDYFAETNFSAVHFQSAVDDLLAALPRPAIAETPAVSLPAPSRRYRLGG